MRAFPTHQASVAAALRALVLLVAGVASAACHAAPPVAHLRLPPGFSASIYTDAVPGARSLRLTPAGTLFVGTMQEGRVYAVTDADGDGVGETVRTVATGLDMPNGVAFRNGALYVAEVSRILRYDDIEAKLAAPPAPVVVYDALPRDHHHGWKYIDFGPDGRLYVPVGAPCNVCDEPLPYQSILRLDPDGSHVETVARGIRNSVGFAWHPLTHELWFTDNGRDWLGDDLPSCELNRITAIGQHFGFPYIHQGDLPDPEFGAGHNPADYVPPVVKLGAHVAPLGIEFYTGSQFPERYRNRAFIALHGSWNRSSKVGYQVVSVALDPAGRALVVEPFIEGWLEREQNWGRPVDLEQMPDGSLLVSDDAAGAIYRIRYSPPGAQ